MKTTVEIDDELLRRAKRTAVSRDCSLRELIERGLQRELDTPSADQKIAWGSASGPWPKDVDFSDREAMWAWLAGEKRPRDRH